MHIFTEGHEIPISAATRCQISASSSGEAPQPEYSAARASQSIVAIWKRRATLCSLHSSNFDLRRCALGIAGSESRRHRDNSGKFRVTIPAFFVENHLWPLVSLLSPGRFLTHQTCCLRGIYGCDFLAPLRVLLLLHSFLKRSTVRLGFVRPRVTLDETGGTSTPAPAGPPARSVVPAAAWVQTTEVAGEGETGGTLAALLTLRVAILEEPRTDQTFGEIAASRQRMTGVALEAARACGTADSYGHPTQWM